MSQQLDQLHRTVYQTLNPEASVQSSSASTSASTVQPLTTTVATGDFITEFDNGIVHYAVTYNNSPFSVTYFSTYQGEGNSVVYQHQISWDGYSYTWANPEPTVPSSASSPLAKPLNWSGSAGICSRMT